MPINDLRRTQGHKGHSSKPTTFHGIEGEGQRYMHQGPAGHTRRQHKLFPGQAWPGHVHMDEKFHKDMRKYNAYKSKTKKGKTGGRRLRRGTRSTRRR